ncbi:hypothetical protein EON63_13195 [archaeon]|nr:MAG: hypothetical protein EON63_13195 [archaeon]
MRSRRLLAGLLSLPSRLDIVGYSQFSYSHYNTSNISSHIHIQTHSHTRTHNQPPPYRSRVHLPCGDGFYPTLCWGVVWICPLLPGSPCGVMIGSFMIYDPAPLLASC